MSIKAKLKKSNGQTNIDKYRVRNIIYYRKDFMELYVDMLFLHCTCDCFRNHQTEFDIDKTILIYLNKR